MSGKPSRGLILITLHRFFYFEGIGKVTIQVCYGVYGKKKEIKVALKQPLKKI